jgi:4-amino-4-deoxy-L-arabinose transferase-like glycosyltransferase
VVLGSAICLRLIFAAITAGTYDPDEFVILSLSRQVAHGAAAYRDFMFFHPPGVLVILGGFQPVIGAWWPLARAFIVAADVASALLVWRIATIIYDRRGALAAGLIYAASPIALLGSVRVGQDPLITLFGLAGMLALLSRPGRAAAVVAGICVAIAVWIKYPAILFLPVYAAIAPRRLLLVVGAASATLMILFAPFASRLNLLYAQSIVWQVSRGHMDLIHRAAAVVSFLFVLNPLALAGVLWRRAPGWVLLGFVLGGAFGLANEVYYHYFMPIVPFAALLAGPLAARLVDRARIALPAATAGFVTLWAASLTLQPVQDGLGALSLSATSATVQLIDHVTRPGDRVLADQFEYTYLADRTPATDYFWDMRTLTSARTLEYSLPRAAAVVRTAGADPSYPSGFVEGLADAGYVPTRSGTATVWLAGHYRGRLRASDNRPRSS